jgi:hypothetical protein
MPRHLMHELSKLTKDELLALETLEKDGGMLPGQAARFLGKNRNTLYTQITSAGLKIGVSGGWFPVYLRYRQLRDVGTG